MIKSPSELSVLELMRVFTDIKYRQPDVCMRFRTIGELWHPNFCRIIDVNEKKIALLDELTNKLLFVSIDSIMQLEFDQRFQDLQPHYHYDVVISERKLA